MRHDDLRGIPSTMLQPALIEEATILKENQPCEAIDSPRASERTRVSELDRGECSCLTFFARMLIWGSRNSQVE